jgi:hypothetical protein
MREKLNENPVAQIALIGILALGAVFFLLKPFGGGETEEAAEAPPPSEAAPGEAGALAPTGAVTAVKPPTDFRPLPTKVEQAYKRGETLALLVYRDGGIDDRLVSETAAVLDGMSDVAFFNAPAKKIARYSAITGPLGVNQAPALVVVRSRKLNKNGIAPGTVTYGYLSGAEIRQAVVDSKYRGRKLTYAPS